MKMFAVRDLKVEKYMKPFFAETTGEAIRYFEGLVVDPQTTVARWPRDFVLYELGVFDEESALCETHSPLELGSAADFMPKGELKEVG